MKKYLLLVLPILFLAVASCDSEDDSTETPDTTSQTDDSDDDTGDGTDDDTDDQNDQMEPLSYFSLTAGDQWNYESTTDMNETTQDTLSVIGDVIIDDVMFKDLEVNMENGGFMTGLFSTGGLREENTILEYSGAISFPLDDMNTIDIEIPLLKLYDESIPQGMLIDQIEQVVEQEIDGTPITVTTVVSSYSQGLNQNVTINGFPFESTINSNLTINATITATLLGITVTVLEPQDILVVENAYAQNIGLVSSDLNFNYEFVDLSALGITLPFPQTGSGTSQQLVVDYEVAGDD